MKQESSELVVAKPTAVAKQLLAILLAERDIPLTLRGILHLQSKPRTTMPFCEDHGQVTLWTRGKLSPTVGAPSSVWQDGHTLFRQREFSVWSSNIRPLALRLLVCVMHSLHAPA